MRRPLLVAALACGVGGLLVLLAAGRTWGAVTAGAPGQARQHVAVSGSAVAPALSALGIALLALAVAMLAGSGLVRRIVALVVVAVGGATIGVAARARGDVGTKLADRLFASSLHSVGGSRPAWWLLALAGGVIAVVAGAVVAVRSATWAGLGARYDAPAPAEHATADAWEALDRGHDPTE
jgi:uncharacterized membrane protein (TIGR02234 family)